MRLQVSRSVLSGQVDAPGSKSLMQRFAAAALMARGTSIIRTPYESADSIAALATAELLGAELALDAEGNYHITGGKQAPDQPLHVGESGLSMRLFTPIAAMSGYTITLTGSGSLLRRPVGMFEPVFKSMGAAITTSNGFLPVTVKGPLTGGDCTLDGTVSSQFLSGLLMALPLAERDSVVTVEGLNSKPYVDMTLEVMARFGVSVVNRDYQKFFIQGRQHYTPADVVCEGDWSGGAALLVAAAVAGERIQGMLGTNDGGVRVGNLDTGFSQADSSITGVLMFAGAKMIKQNGHIALHAGRLKGFNYNATDSPDLFPVLAVLASACETPSSIAGVNRLIHKESNRAEALQTEFAKAGIHIEIQGDHMTVNPSDVKPCHFDARGDHRMAMAGALLGLRGGPVTVEGASCISKSYPTFFDDLRALGASIKRLA